MTLNGQVDSGMDGQSISSYLVSSHDFPVKSEWAKLFNVSKYLNCPLYVSFLIIRSKMVAMAVWSDWG